MEGTPVKASFNESAENFDTDPQRSETIKMVKQKAPDWFSSAFDFILCELSRIQTNAQTLSKCANECEQNKKQITSLTQRVQVLEAENKNLTDQIVNLENYSRKTNLIFKGIPEKGPSEDIKQLIINFMENNLEIENAKSISLSEVHRLGKPPHLLPKAQHRPRDVLVKFVSLSDRNNIWSKRMSLKNTKYFLSEDYPAIVQQRRRILMPYLNQAKKSHSVAKCALVGDKLLVDGKTFTVDTVKDGMFTDEKVTESQVKENLRQLSEIDAVAFFGKKCFFSNFYTSPIEDGGKKFATVEHFYQFKKATYFNDASTAAAILGAKTPEKSKALGYLVKDYEEELWHKVAPQVMFNGCLKKLQQYPQLAESLKKLKGGIIEANPKDVFFSCGLALHSPHIMDKTRWPGKNILGNILCQVRDTLDTADTET